ncbi:MAG: hypothetical protein WBA74_11450 [Cyclobacteriaceae bacterium]
MKIEFAFTLLKYLIEASLILSVLSLLYIMLFKKLTFYKLNRIVIYVILLVSVGVPLIDYEFKADKGTTLSVLRKSPPLMSSALYEYTFY